MPKFQSVLTKKEVMSDSGMVIGLGEVVWVPLDDAAILEPHCEQAIEAKVWINQKTGKPVTKAEWEEMKIKVKAEMDKKAAEDMKKRPSY